MGGDVRVRLAGNGRVVIPSSIRKELDMHEGDELLLRVEHDELRLSTLKQRIARAQRHARRYVKAGVSLVDELLAERRGEAKRE